MEWIAFSGYLAAGLVFLTFCMKTMIPLRVVAILSNVAFITYGVLNHLYPILGLHMVMLPLNVFRLYEIRRLVRHIAEASLGEFAVKALAPIMKRHRFEKGDVLFRKGDDAHEVLFIDEGTVKVEELDMTIGPGTLIGEIGVFAPDHRRTQTVTCVTNVELLGITDQKIYELYYQEPKLAFYLMRLIIGRLLSNATR